MLLDGSTGVNGASWPAGAWNTGLKVPGFIPERFGGGLPIIGHRDTEFSILRGTVGHLKIWSAG